MSVEIDYTKLSRKSTALKILGSKGHCSSGNKRFPLSKPFDCSSEYCLIFNECNQRVYFDGRIYKKDKCLDVIKLSIQEGILTEEEIVEFLFENNL